MAARAAALTGSGTSKSGWPMLRLTGSFRLRPRSKTRRMPEASMLRIRSATQRSPLPPDATATPSRHDLRAARSIVLVGAFGRRVPVADQAEDLEPRLPQDEAEDRLLAHHR